MGYIDLRQLRIQVASDMQCQDHIISTLQFKATYDSKTDVPDMFHRHLGHRAYKGNKPLN